MLPPDRTVHDTFFCFDCNHAWAPDQLRPGVTCVLCPNDECRGMLKTWQGRALDAERSLSRLREALAQIRDQDSWENALDPQWAARIAKEALNG